MNHKSNSNALGDKENNKSMRTQFRSLILDLTMTLIEYGLEDIVYRRRGGIAILPDKIKCDYCYYLEKKEV